MKQPQDSKCWPSLPPSRSQKAYCEVEGRQVKGDCHRWGRAAFALHKPYQAERRKNKQAINNIPRLFTREPKQHSGLRDCRPTFPAKMNKATSPGQGGTTHRPSAPGRALGVGASIASPLQQQPMRTNPVCSNTQLLPSSALPHPPIFFFESP